MADTADPNAMPPSPATPQAPAPDPVEPQNLPQIVNVRRNRIPGVIGQNNLINVRQRLFHEIYFKIAIMYAQFIPVYMRRAFEYFILFKALIFFSALVYLHMAFIKNPATCLQHIKDWPRDGVLRVEVIPNLERKRAIMERTKAFEMLTMELQQNFYFGIGPQTKDNQFIWRRYEQMLNDVGYGLQRTFVNKNESVLYYFKMDRKSQSDDIQRVPTTALQFSPVLNEPVLDDIDDGDFLFSFLFKRSLFLMLLDAYGNPDEQYIVEYSLEYGHLRLSAATRKRLQIPVRVVQLDPMKDKCFGDSFSKFMLRKILGYDDLLMASVRVIAEQEDNKGYLRNVITGEHYRFVSMWWAAWSSYPTAFSVMLLFTFSISMLLRFSHHQIFVFIVDLLQMLEFNITARFPIAPLLTVILALVGMEAIMSEFFNDATTAFYIILIVWIADQYDAICCHTTITKRHWLRFFYLYHFAFYAYHHRFSGQNRNLSLITSWLFIQHSMVFFFHRFELPMIVQQAQIIFLTRNQPNAAAAAGAGAGAGAGMGVDAGAGAGAGAGGGPNADAATGDGGINNGEAAADQHQHQQTLRQGIFLLRQQPIRIFPVRNRPINWESIQRAILQRGWRANLPLRVQIGNVHSINVHSVQQNAERLVATAAVQTTRFAPHDAETNDATNESVTTTTSPPPTNSSSPTTPSSGGNASVRNATNGTTTTAANSSETNIKSNEEATIPPSKPSSTTVITATLDSSDGHNVRPSQNVQQLETSTGNNHIEWQENVENNKTENEVAGVKQQEEDEEEKQANYVDGEIMKIKCFDNILAARTTTTTATATATTRKGENEESAGIQATEIPTTSTAAIDTDETTYKSSKSRCNTNNNKKGNPENENENKNNNEQLENDLYAIVKGDLRENATESLKQMAAAQGKTIAITDDEFKLQDEIVRHGLTANSADMLQPINQKNIENNELMSHIVATTSTSRSTSNSSIQLKRNGNFDMIDSVERWHLTQADDKTCCNSYVGNENNSESESTKDSSALTSPAATTATTTSTKVGRKPPAAEALEFSKTLVTDRIDLSCCDGKNVDLLSINRNEVNNFEHQHQQLSTANFIVHEAAYSSEF